MPYGSLILTLARGSRNIINEGHNAIIVVMNYRVGAFGFLPSRELAKEGSLNAGVLDVAEAFKWTRKYISEFGGNPRQVTGFGLSSGGCIYSFDHSYSRRTFIGSRWKYGSLRPCIPTIWINPTSNGHS